VKVLLILLCMACVIDAADAQTLCGKREPMVAQLAEGYDETRVAAAVTRQGALLEVFASVDGTWSILMTIPGGRTCIVSVGEQGWELEPLGTKL